MLYLKFFFHLAPIHIKTNNLHSRNLFAYISQVSSPGQMGFLNDSFILGKINSR